jgi:hypothetical protein
LVDDLTFVERARNARRRSASWGPVALASVFAGVPHAELSLQIGTVSPALMRILSLIRADFDAAVGWCGR